MSESKKTPNNRTYTQSLDGKLKRNKNASLHIDDIKPIPPRNKPKLQQKKGKKELPKPANKTIKKNIEGPVKLIVDVPDNNLVLKKQNMKRLNLSDTYDVAVWEKELYETTNTTFMPLYTCESRYLVLRGGAGSGKSLFAGRKIIERCVGERGHRFLVVRDTQTSLKESSFQQIQEQLIEHYPNLKYNINKTDMTIQFQNGNRIIFKGLDDVGKIKSIASITGIWIEEASEVDEGDFNELDLRLRGKTSKYHQIILTFNPVSITSWLKKRFFDIDDPRATTHFSTYKDNRFINDEYIQTLEAYKDTDEYRYTVYALGEWGVTGKTVFNGVAVTNRLAENIQPIMEGYFDGQGEFVQDSSYSIVKIYTDVEQGVPYVIGGDTAGAGSDSFVGQVIDNTNGQQVAILRHTFAEDVYSYQMYCLGMYYNTALLAIEVNFSSYPIRELERLGYQNMYVREQVDTYTGRLYESFGFQTNVKTRPIIIAELIKVLNNDINLVVDKTTLEEMLTFVRNESFKPEAEKGMHDDCIMALAIAHHARSQQTRHKQTHSPDVRVVWTTDMWEDYYRAKKEDKAYLLSKWGTPKR